MSLSDTAHAWWSRLRHQGLLLSPVVMIERHPDVPPEAPFHSKNRLRDAHNRMKARVSESGEIDPSAVLSFVDALLEHFVGHPPERFTKQHSIPENLTVALRVGSKTETVRPHRVLYADEAARVPALLVLADSSPCVGRGRGRTNYAQLLELLRGTGHRLGLLTNGQQFRLVYAGLDFESWCEWDSDRWFDDGDGTQELLGFRQLLSPESLKTVKDGASGLLDGVEESRKRQADLSSVLRENVRQAVEYLLNDVSTSNRTNAELFQALVRPAEGRNLSDAEAHEALMQATVRVVMRLVVCLFAESRQLLPVNDPIYSRSYGVRALYELLEEAARCEGGTHVLFNRQTAWPRLMALFRLVHGGSAHGAFPLRPYGGVLFRPGDEASGDPVARALHILEHNVAVCDDTIYYVLRKLLRGPLPVIRGKSKTFVDGPVDYTDLRTEFIGLIYEGLLDYRVKRTDELIGPQVFLNIGREPVLPLSRLTEMLSNDKKGLKDLLTTLRKEKTTASAADDEEESDEDSSNTEGDDDTAEEVAIEEEASTEIPRDNDYLDAYESAISWGKDAVVLAGLVSKQGKKETDAEYQNRIEGEARKLVKRVVAVGEFYLVRAGNTRKGTGTFYTRPQLAVPTTHRTLEPLCYDRSENGTLTPKTPEAILGLKVCDPACGSASFLVAALHYLTDALYRSLCVHRKLDDPRQSKKITLPLGRPRSNPETDQLLPFPPNDPQRGDMFEERVKALLRRHVVERCIYGVDINPLAVELARVSLWVETLDPDLPFSFLDHKIKVGNALVGCWLDRVEDYPLKAWEREGGDGKDGPRTLRLEALLKGEKVGNRRTGDGRIKQEMRKVIESKFRNAPQLFPTTQGTTESVVAEARSEYEKIHDISVGDPDEREQYYREHVERSQSLRTLKDAMDEWCAVWFWPTDEESLKSAPTPLTFHQADRSKDAIVRQVSDAMRFFHWEIEYPDVFTPVRSGFDAMIGNPPWDVMKPNSQEFFTEFDPLYRTLEKQSALKRQKELFSSVPGLRDHWEEYNSRFKGLSNWVGSVAVPFEMTLARGAEEKSLQAAWATHRQERVGFADSNHPFRIQGTADLNTYKLFTELLWQLLVAAGPGDSRSGGRLGVILPTGIYSDLGTKTLRETFFTSGRIDFLYAFQNEKKIFAGVDHRFKQVALFATRGGSTQQFLTRFRMGVGNSPHAHELPDDLLRRDHEAMTFSLADVRRNSPKTLSLVELGSEREAAIFRTIYDHSFRIGDNLPGWEIKYATEFHMTNDSKHFPPREKWESQGYKPDAFGRWIGPDGDVALPLYQGRVIHHYDFWKVAYVSGKGANAVWREIPLDSKQPVPMSYMGRDTFLGFGAKPYGTRVVFRDIARSTDTRTMIACCIPEFPCNNKVPILTSSASIRYQLCLSSLLSSMTFDWTIRQRLTSASLNWFIVEECPLPSSQSDDLRYSRLSSNSGRLTLLHRCFSAEWLKLKEENPTLDERAWKHWWAVTEADRLRLRVEIEAICADLYGLNPDDFDWIVRDDPKDSKGFYRVDRHLPFRERLTGLAAAAFRALKDDRWSPESAAHQSNEEFFEILGIPEMTTGPDPLIKKRDGCHRWAPEEFGEDDPRFGWTWDHCWQDAVALLGSDEAVQKYVAGETTRPEEANSEPERKGSKDLFGNPIPVKPKQKKLF